MKRISVFLVLGLICLISLGFINHQHDSNRVNQSFLEKDIRFVTGHPQKKDVLFVGTSRSLYQSIDNGQNFEEILRPQGSNAGVNYLYIYVPDDTDEIDFYAATDSGLYVSHNQGSSWKRIFYSKDENKSKCLSVLAGFGRIYVGTKSGGYFKEGNSNDWKKIGGDFDRTPIYFLLQDNENIYGANGVALIRKGKDSNEIKQVFESGLSKGADENEFLSDEEISDSRVIKFVFMEDEANPVIYLATTRGVFVSDNQAESWKKLKSSGAPLSLITSMTLSRDGRLFVGTSRGMYFYENDKWMPVHSASLKNISCLHSDNFGNLCASTEHGLFFVNEEKAVASQGVGQFNAEAFPDYVSISKYFEFEPSIGDVHKKAINYARVSNKKIDRWHKQSRWKSLVPNISAGIDRADSDLYHWDTGQKPDMLLRGTDYIDWDVSASWDLADIVWSTDQTSIDSRAKMMVELREEILDQVTRLYFERRRLQVGLVSLSGIEAQSRIEKEMRIAELTSLLDAFTGGAFSEYLKTSHGSRDTGH